MHPLRPVRMYERAFLNLPRFHGGAHVLAFVEDTSQVPVVHHRLGDEDLPVIRTPLVVLEIADCEHRISLAFELDTAADRRNAMHKVDSLIDVLLRLRAGLVEECAVLRRREAEVAAGLHPHGADSA